MYAKNKLEYGLAVMVLLSFLLAPAMAQDQASDEGKWNFTVAPYFIFPNMNGEVAINGLSADVSANPGDIFSNLDFGMMLYFEAANPDWSISLDGLYMKLSKDGKTPITERDVSVDMNQFAITLNGLYRIAPWAEIGLGGRVNSLGSTVSVAPGEQVLPGNEVSLNETWFDPLIVARFMTRFNTDKWRLGLLTDMGGFGLGSNFAWQVYPFAGYQISRLIEIDIAYRWLGMTYETGEGTDYFLYDLVISGPEIGLLFHF